MSSKINLTQLKQDGVNQEAVAAELSIVIVNWNGITLLPACFKSIVENPPGVPFEIVVVDNDSADQSVEWMKSPEAKAILKDTKFTLIESSENLGFGVANNLAFEKTTSPYLFVLNPDTMVTAGAINHLIETLRSSEKIGMTAPRLLDENGAVTKSVSNFPDNPLSILVHDLKLYKLIPRHLFSDWLYAEHWTYDKRQPVPIVAGAAMMCKREMIDAVGGFDSSIHMYGEDLEWCVRINRSGWQIYFEPLADVYHIGGKTTEQRWDKKEINLIQEKAIVRFNHQCFPPTLNFVNGLTKSFVLCLHYLRWKITGRDASLLVQLLKMQMNSCYDLLKNSFKK